MTHKGMKSAMDITAGDVLKWQGKLIVVLNVERAMPGFAQIAAIELDTSVVTSQRIVAAVIMKHEAVSVYSSHSERC